MKTIALIIIIITAAATLTDAKSTPQLVRLAGTQPNYIYPDAEYCIVPQDNVRKAKLKLKWCKDRLQEGKRNWIIDGNLWKSAEEPTLCVEVAKVRKGKTLRLNKCRNKGKQKWSFDDAGKRDEIVIKPKKNRDLCIAYESDDRDKSDWYDDNNGVGSASAGDDILLVDCDKVIDCDTQDSPCLGRPVRWEITDTVDDDGAGEGDKDKCKLLQFPNVKGELCLHAMWGYTDHGTLLDAVMCDEDDDAQYWCSDDLDRIQPMADKGLCIEADCMREGGNCGVRLQYCEQNESKQLWKTSKIVKIFGGEKSPLRPESSSDFCLYVDPDSKAGVEKTPSTLNGEDVTLTDGCSTKISALD